MKQTLIVPLLLASLLLPGSAMAKPLTPSVGSMMKALGGPTIPAEWEGEWETKDSLYFCGGPLLLYSEGRDTLCGGAAIEPGSDCTGTVTPTTFDGTCTSSYQEEGCTATTTTVMQITRNDDSYRAVLVGTTTYSGTPECEKSVPFCVRIVTEGTRLGPPPEGSCAITPVKRSSWGQLKSIYR